MHTQPQELSLKDALMAVNNSLDAACDEVKPLKKRRKTHSPKIDELEAFCRLDPLLAALRKDFLHFKADTEHAVQQFGADSPMADIAMDAEDSAWCAMQTRLLEVRGDRDLMQKAQTMILDSEREERFEQEKAELEKAQKLAEKVRFLNVIQQREDRKNQKDGGLVAWLLFYLYIYQQNRPEHFMLGRSRGFMAAV